MRTPKTPRSARYIYVVETKIDGEFKSFGCKRAIFEYYGNRTLDLSYSTAIQQAFDYYENNKCVIRRVPLLTATCKEVVEKRQADGRDPLPKHEFNT